MGLQEELGLPSRIRSVAHEAVLSVVLTGALLAKTGSRVLRPFGLTDAQFNVLMLLKYQSEKGELSQTSLGSMLLVNRSNVTGLIDRMEQAGWVERTAAPGDRRVKYVRLRPAGRMILARAEKAYFARVEKVMSAVPAAEHRRLSRILELVRKRLND